MVDWSELLPELLVEIAKVITFHEEFISFSDICSSWRSATSNWDDFQRLPSRYPSLLVLDDERQECQIHLLHGGWLLKIEQDTTNAKLFHPFFFGQIDLPDMKSLPDADLDEGFCGDRTQVCRVLLSSDPTTEENEQDLIVMVICGDRGYLAFCKPSDSSWTHVQQGWRSRVVDLCYYKGRAYTYDCGGLIRSCDLNSKKPVMLPVSKRSLIRLEDDIRDVEYDHILPPWNANHGKLFVVSDVRVLYPYSEEELKKLEVKKYDRGEADVFFSTQSLLVFQCDLKTGERSKVENLGNRAIFVGLSSPFIMEALGCIKANCIYFTDNIGNKDFIGDAGNVGKLDMVIYHFSDRTIEPHFSVQSISEFNNPMWIAPPNF